MICPNKIRQKRNRGKGIQKMNELDTFKGEDMLVNKCLKIVNVEV